MPLPDIPTGMLVLLGLAAATFVALRVVTVARTEQAVSARVQQAEDRVSAEPEKSKFAWDLARLTLEAYFDRNLRQVTAIFWLSVAVMLAGVMIIFWGIAISVQGQESTLPALITGGSGVITEVIGATFLVLYRSTMQQAEGYTRTLERINAVGMAMQVLDTMPAGQDVDSAKNKTKAELVMVLVTQSYELTKAKAPASAHLSGSKADAEALHQPPKGDPSHARRRPRAPVAAGEQAQ
jgi:nitrate reductase gamma subunit